MKEDPEKMNSYLKDLQEISDLARRNDENPLVEYWDFISWGILLIIGTLLHSLFFPRQLNHALLVIWLPIILVGGVVESLAWAAMVKKLQVPLTNRHNRRKYISLLTVFTAVCISFFYIIHLNGPVPGLMLILLSILFAMIVQMSYFALIAETLITLAAGIILTVLDVHGTAITTATGIYTGCVFLIMGLHARYLEKKHGN